MDLTGADDATRHYVERTLLQYRLAGVDKDEDTRTKIKELQDKATQLSLTFGRNVQEKCESRSGWKSRRTGRPSRRLYQGAPTQRTRANYSHHRLSRLSAGDDPLRKCAAASADVPAYNTRAYPANEGILLNLLKVRRQIAGILGFETWADLATADQMMATASNLKRFCPTWITRRIRRGTRIRDGSGICAAGKANNGFD